MTIDVQGVTGVGQETVALSYNLAIPPATASIGGVCFYKRESPEAELSNVRELLLSAADWEFFITALGAPPRVDAALRKLLTESSVLDR